MNGSRRSCTLTGCDRGVGLIVRMLPERHRDDEFVIGEDQAFRWAFLREVDDAHRSEPGQLFVNVLHFPLDEVGGLANTLGSAWVMTRNSLNICPVDVCMSIALLRRVTLLGCSTGTAGIPFAVHVTVLRKSLSERRLVRVLMRLLSE